MPQPDRWADEDTVYTFGSGNGIDVIYALLTFYLDQNGDVLVRLSEIIRHGAKHIGAVRNGDARMPSGG